MNILNCKCNNKNESTEEWYFENEGITYVYSTFKPFMTLLGERPGQTSVYVKYAHPNAHTACRIAQYLPLNPNAPEKSIERFYQLLLLQQ